MSAENKAIAKSFLQEVLNGKAVASVDKYVAANYVEHSVLPGLPNNREGFKELLNQFFNAFPDMKATVEDIIAEEDKIVLRVTSSGTHKGEFMGIAPTGKSFSIGEIHIMRMENGQMVEHWGIEDNMSMMQQLGVIPS